LTRMLAAAAATWRSARRTTGTNCTKCTVNPACRPRGYWLISLYTLWV
jgi:hypothetical protein